MLLIGGKSRLLNVIQAAKQCPPAECEFQQLVRIQTQPLPTEHISTVM